MKKRFRFLKREHVSRDSQNCLPKMTGLKDRSFFSFVLFSAAVLFGQVICAYALEDQGQSAAVLEKAVRLREAGQIEKAEIEIKKALDFDPANFAYRFELANIYAAQYDLMKTSGAEEQSQEYLQKAARELEQAVMLQPKHIPARFNLGVVYKKQGRFEEARKHFSEVTKLDPNPINGLMQIGATYEEQGFFDEARSVYLEAKELDFNNPDIRLTLDELEKRKEESQQRSRDLPAVDGFAKLARLQSSDYQRLLQRDSPDTGQSLKQAAPYLGAWLLQQFMKARQPKE